MRRPVDLSVNRGGAGFIRTERVKGGSGKIIAGFRATWEELVAAPHDLPPIRRCKSCGVRKLLDRGFYRDRTCRGGFRQVCKKCRNRERAAWARRRYLPKTGRRYVTKGDKKEAAAAAQA